MYLYWIIFIGSMLASCFVSWMMKRKMQHHSGLPIALTGKQIAEQMLRENNIRDVSVTCVDGFLTDHYNPVNKTVNLSPEVYNGANVAAAAVAAHECGHAVQHARAYHWLSLRTAMVPTVTIASSLGTWVILGGLVLLAASGNPWILIIGIVCFALTTLFAFVTLPVEFNASHRALEWIRSSGYVSSRDQECAKSALFWAAMTYVVSALASLASLLYYVMILMGARRDD